MIRKQLSAILASALFGGCIYANVHTPLSYRSPTPSDVPGSLGPVVQAEVCNQMVLWVVAWGDAGYSAAVEKAKAASGASTLVDIQADTRVFNVLGVYQKSCTRIHARTVR
jgi:hypothetical protein